MFEHIGTYAELCEFLSAHGLGVEESRQGAGKFQDLSTGTGKPIGELRDLQALLNARRVYSEIHYTDNREHPDFGKHFLCIRSFWVE